MGNGKLEVSLMSEALMAIEILAGVVSPAGDSVLGMEGLVVGFQPGMKSFIDASLPLSVSVVECLNQKRHVSHGRSRSQATDI